KNRIDGKDVWPLLAGQKGARSPHEAYFFYWLNELHAVRSGRWKLHLPHDYTRPNPPGRDGKPGRGQRLKIGLSLFDLEKDPGETTDVAEKYPDVVRRLRELAERAREDLGDSATRRKGKGVREPGRL